MKLFVPFLYCKLNHLSTEDFLLLRDADIFTGSEHVRTHEHDYIPLHNTSQSGGLGLYWSDFDTLLYAEAWRLIGSDM